MWSEVPFIYCTRSRSTQALFMDIKKSSHIAHKGGSDKCNAHIPTINNTGLFVGISP